MKRVKIITGKYADDLQNNVNTWIEKNTINVVDIKFTHSFGEDSKSRDSKEVYTAYIIHVLTFNQLHNAKK